MKDKREFLLIKTNDGIFISDVLNGWSHPQIEKFRFNQEKALPTFHRNWFKINSSDDIEVEKIIPATTETTGYRLKEGFPVSEGTPAEVAADFFAWNSEEDDYNHSDIKGIYEPIEVEHPEIYEIIEAEFKVLAEINNLEQLKPLDLTGYFKGSFGNESRKISDKENLKEINHQYIDKIIFHNDLLPLRPVELSSVASYAILREYIKTHLDYEVCKITSDYDFCFTVCKRIKLIEPKPYKYDANFSVFGRKRKPKYVTKIQTESIIQVFEIAPKINGKVYEGYSEMPSFQGYNYRDLEKKVKEYCKEIIEKLNTPAHYCTKCKGVGVLEEKINLLSTKVY